MSGADNVGKACVPEHAGAGQGRPSLNPDPVPCRGWGIDTFLDAAYGEAKPPMRYMHRDALRVIDRHMGYKMGLSPHDVHARDVRRMLDSYISWSCWMKREDMLGYLDEYLMFYGNSAVRDTMGRSYARRGKVACLDEAEYLDLMGAPKTPTQDVVVHLEACCGLRTSECSRLKLCDLHLDHPRPHIVVRGNGVRQDRSVALDADTILAITRWMLQRPSVAEDTRLCHSGWEDPGTLLLQTDPRRSSWKGGEWDSYMLSYEVTDQMS
ncbi:MAG: site-specific integrase [Candidatus Methanomethylophilaceae archaeon]|nr:site-specific integrase [Candidatus Methanomethylophilaceae archaeon]